MQIELEIATKQLEENEKKQRLEKKELEQALDQAREELLQNQKRICMEDIVAEEEGKARDDVVKTYTGLDSFDALMGVLGIVAFIGQSTINMNDFKTKTGRK
eukprot:comp24326_c0_seq1/m.45943 comp24326_c0_seq1/g.45943  ORF comp24326_c0_seq1/g.45943 comp24326_c0_seq1/m.45943 type:complete len:102 (-) comp24326_c0_seq1:829-1134(-)